jgi:glycosyltransferase involved in cell wall biosynthesis
LSAISLRHDVEAIRARYVKSGQKLIGHFGTCGGRIGAALHGVVPKLLKDRQGVAIVFIGRDGESIREDLVRKDPSLRDRIHATGGLSNPEVSSHISACDLMVQPYPDGVTSRRSSLMAALSHCRAVVTTSGHLTEPLWHLHPSVALAPAGNNDQIIACIERLLDDDIERQRLARAGEIMYDRHFSLPKLIQSLRNQSDAPAGASVWKA